MNKKNIIIFILCLSVILGLPFMAYCAYKEGGLITFIQVCFETFTKYFILAIAFSIIIAILNIKNIPTTKILHRFLNLILNLKTWFCILLILLILSVSYNVYQYNKYTELSDIFSKYRATMEGNYSGWTLEEIQKLFNGEL